MKCMCVLAVICIFGCLVPAVAVPAGAADGPLGTTSTVIMSDAYRIIPWDGGKKIIMDGFGQRMEPGAPMLPAKRVLIALPPGARVQYIEAEGIGGAPLSGSYRIVPAPRIVPLAGGAVGGKLAARMQREWREKNETIYSTDDPYPGSLARLVGSGALRKYAYAAVSVCPFSYRPLSGRLTNYDAVRVTVHYSVPSPGSARSMEVERLMHDRTVDEKASELFVNIDQVRGLYDAGPPVTARQADTHDYVIVTTDALTGAIYSSGFVGWKYALGYSVRIVRLTDPEIALQPGADLAERIRNFLRDYYGTWGIQYVLIVGDVATVPMRYSFPNPDDHTHNPGNYPYPGESVPSDNYYADLSLPDADSWDLDGDGYYGEYLHDSPDFLAEVYVGRIPTSDTTRIVYTLEKLIGFEGDDGAWKDRALHPGSILFYENQNYEEYPKIDGCTLLNQIEIDIMSGWTVSHYSEQDGIDPSGYPWPAINVPAWIDDWRTGQYGVVNWSGHGAPFGVGRTVWLWDDGDGVPETDGSDGWSQPSLIDLGCVLDDDHPSIVFAVSCYVGFPEPLAQGNLGIDLLTDPGFGASSGIVSSTRPAWISADVVNNPGGAESVCYEFNRYGITENERLGEALYHAKNYCYVNYGWDHYAEYINQCNFNLYGDPSLLRTGIMVSGAENHPAAARILLFQNYPNPFNPSTVIRFDLSRAAHVTLRVYNVKGELVSTVADGGMPAGRNEVDWKGTDDSGRAVASGVYFYRLAAGDDVRTRKMTLIR